MKSFKVNGVALTEHEIRLLELGDVSDSNELRDLAALRARMENAPIVSRRRLQMQIETLESATTQA
jgi:hypothetical protein